MHEPRDKEKYICMIVDSDHAVDKKSCRSKSGYMIKLNAALDNIIQKKQSALKHIYL